MLNRKSRLAIFKFIGLLSLVRWYNITLVMLAQYLAAIYVLNPGVPAMEVLADPYLHLMLFSTACVIASGFIINSFYDLEKDIINRPGSVVFSRLVSQQTCLNFYFFFNTIGMILSFYVSKRIMLFNFLFSIALWFYSHKLKKVVLVGNIAATLLTVAPFLIIVLYYKEVNFAIFFYVAFMALMVVTREIVKDIIAEKGDVIYGYHTLPVDLGRRRTKLILTGFILLTFIPPVLLYVTYAIGQVIWYFALSYLLLVVAGVLVWQAKNRTDYERINNLYKFLILSGILSLVLV